VQHLTPITHVLHMQHYQTNRKNPKQEKTARRNNDTKSENLNPPINLMRKTLVLIKNDFFRVGISTAIKEISRSELIVEVTNWPEACSNFAQSDIRLLIADMDSQSGNNLNYIKKVRALNPQLKIILIVDNDKVAAIHYLKKGVNGLLSRKMSKEEFHRAFKAVLNGATYASESINNSILNEISGTNQISTLSPREAQVSEFLVKGFRTSEICCELNLAPSTVSTMKTSVYKKMKVTNVIELISKLAVYQLRN
jgi:DNA-binding NarL/FixJ family response regulator